MANANTNLMSINSSRPTTSVSTSSRSETKYRTLSNSTGKKENFSTALDKARQDSKTFSEVDEAVQQNKMEAATTDAAIKTSSQGQNEKTQDAPPQENVTENSQEVIPKSSAQISEVDEEVAPKDSQISEGEKIFQPENFSSNLAYFFSTDPISLLTPTNVNSAVEGEIKVETNLMTILPQTEESQSTSMLDLLGGKTWKSADVDASINQQVQPTNLNQVQQVQPNNLNQAQQIQPNNLNQAQQVQPTNLNQAQQVQPSNLNQAQQVQPNNLNQAQQVQPTNLNQAQQIQPTNFNQAQQVQPTNLNQAQQVQPNNLNQTQQVQPTNLNQAQQIQPNNLNQTQQVQPNNLNQAQQVQPNNLNQAQQVQPSNLNQAQQVQPNNLNQAQQVQPNNLNQAQQVQPTNLNQAQQVQPNNLNQAQQVQPTNLNQAQQVQPTNLNQAQQVQPNSLNQAQQVQPNNLNQTQQVQPNNLNQAQQVQPNNLNQAQQVQPSNLNQAQSVQQQQFGQEISPVVNSEQPQAEIKPLRQENQLQAEILSDDLPVEENRPTSQAIPIFQTAKNFAQHQQQSDNFQQSNFQQSAESEVQIQPQSVSNGGENFSSHLTANNNSSPIQQPAQTAQTQNPEATQQFVSDNYDIRTQIVEHARLIRRAENTEMVINLKPEHLGAMTLKITVTHTGALNASFYSDNAQVRAIIENSLVQLKNELNEQGLKVEHVEVYAGLSDGGSLMNGRGQQAWQQNQQQRNSARRINLNSLEENADSTAPVNNAESTDGVDYKV